MVYETYKTKTKKPINETKDSVYWDAMSLSFVGRISDSVTRQDRSILLAYATLTQPTNRTHYHWDQ